MLIAASIYMEIKFKSAAGLVGLFIFTGIFLLTEFKHVSIDLRWGLIASAVVFLIFVVFQSQEMFTGILVNILHRDITASTRTMGKSDVVYRTETNFRLWGRIK